MNAHTMESAERYDTLRAEVRRVMEADGLNQRQVSDATGISYGTFTPFMGGTYQGKLGPIADKIERWLETRRAGEDMISVLPEEPSFVPMKVAEEISSVLIFSHVARDFGVVVGAAGIGKSMAIKNYAETHSNVFVWTAEKSTHSTNAMLEGIAETMDLEEVRASRISRLIKRRVKGANALIIVDEAQHLETSALDQLRAFPDMKKEGCGVVVVGNESLLTRLNGGTSERHRRNSQLHSRVGMRTIISKAKSADIATMIDAWGLFAGEPERKFLTQIAKKSGALRVMNRVIRLATMHASSVGQPVALPHIRTAFDKLSSMPIDEAA